MTDLADRRGVDLTVYEPAEDSALLAGAVAADLQLDGLVIDVGTGSGYIADRLAEALDVRVVGADRNPHACRTARAHGVESVLTDLLAGFRADCAAAVVFNPPYLPVDPEAEWDDWFEVAVSGGQTGREVIDRFLADVGRVLQPDGRAYLLVSTATGVAAVTETAGAAGFHVIALEDASFPGETLTVLKLVR